MHSQRAIVVLYSTAYNHIVSCYYKLITGSDKKIEFFALPDPATRIVIIGLEVNHWTNITTQAASQFKSGPFGILPQSNVLSQPSPDKRVWATALCVRVDHQAPLIHSKNIETIFGDINHYFTVMVQVIEEHDGTIYQLDSDTLLAVFGMTSSLENHAQRSVGAAVCLLTHLTNLNNRRLDRGEIPFRIGIGVNTGQMVVGPLQVGGQTSSAVLGEGIDGARELGDLNTQTPFHTIFISESTLRELPNPGHYQVDNLGEIHLRGVARPLTVYALMQPVPS